MQDTVTSPLLYCCFLSNAGWLVRSAAADCEGKTQLLTMDNGCCLQVNQPSSRFQSKPKVLLTRKVCAPTHFIMKGAHIPLPPSNKTDEPVSEKGEGGQSQGKYLHFVCLHIKAVFDHEKAPNSTCLLINAICTAIYTTKQGGRWVKPSF